MKKSKTHGFNYCLTNEAIERYREKPPELRLKWLYMGNLLRKGYDKRVTRLHDRFREGEI